VIDNKQKNLVEREEFFHLEGHIVYLILSIIYCISYPLWVQFPSGIFSGFLSIGIFLTLFAIIWNVLFKLNFNKSRSQNGKLKNIISEKDKFFEECESIINHHLNKNKGKAFTTKALRRKIDNIIKDPDLQEYYTKNIKNILKKMLTRGTAVYIQKNGETFYSF